MTLFGTLRIIDDAAVRLGELSENVISDHLIKTPASANHKSCRERDRWPWIKNSQLSIKRTGKLLILSKNTCRCNLHIYLPSIFNGQLGCAAPRWSPIYKNNMNNRAEVAKVSGKIINNLTKHFIIISTHKFWSSSRRVGSSEAWRACKLWMESCRRFLSFPLSTRTFTRGLYDFTSPCHGLGLSVTFICFIYNDFFVNPKKLLFGIAKQKSKYCVLKSHTLYILVDIWTCISKRVCV